MSRTLTGATALAAAAGIGAVALNGAAPSAQADTAETGSFALAEPTGPFRVGTADLHLVDADRADLWVPEADRELMVSMYYPTDEDGPAAPYMTAEESALFMARSAPDYPPELLAAVATNAADGAEPAGDAASLPLVVLSPGFTFPRATLTGLAEELASNGYAVAAVGHAYEAPIMFPDGITECLACTTDDIDSVVPNRAEDLSFVVDELEAGAWEGAELVDFDRIAVGGHSIGGASAHRVLAADDRFDAGFNLDGTFFALDPRTVHDPFLMIGAEVHGQPGEDETWDRAWRKLRGWARWITVEGTNHSSLTDLAPLQEQVGEPGQELDGFRADRIARTLVTGFVDRHLRGEEAPVLDGPTEDWPELEFHMQ